MTLYGKAGCHLCDEAREVVEAVRADVGFELEEVDISLDPGARTAGYGERIPVVDDRRRGGLRATASTPERCAGALGRVGP